MNGSYDRSTCFFTITWDVNCEALHAAPGKIYMPCSNECGKVLVVPENTISSICQECYNDDAPDNAQSHCEDEVPRGAVEMTHVRAHQRKRS